MLEKNMARGFKAWFVFCGIMSLASMASMDALIYCACHWLMTH